jgi:hypothetical protein
MLLDWVHCVLVAYDTRGQGVLSYVLGAVGGSSAVSALVLLVTPNWMTSDLHIAIMISAYVLSSYVPTAAVLPLRCIDSILWTNTISKYQQLVSHKYPLAHALHVLAPAFAGSGGSTLLYRDASRLGKAIVIAALANLQLDTYILYATALVFNIYTHTRSTHTPVVQDTTRTRTRRGRGRGKVE